MNRCIIGVGSNIRPKENIDQMLEILSEEQKFQAHSDWITTAPIGITDQEDFVNGAVLIETEMQQNELNRYLKKVEDRMGRDRSLPKYGPRVIDLDIVVWNDQIVDSDYYERDFLKTSVDQLLSTSL